MFKVKAWIFTPQVIICYILLVAILIAVVSGKPAEDKHTHYELDKDGVIREYSNTEDDGYYTETVKYDAYDTHTLTYRDMKSYQVELHETYAIFYDYNKVAFVVPLDKDCNLTKAFNKDNE